jgi:hypothetical protein
MLLEKGCALMSKTGSGSTAFSLAAEGGRVEVVRLFMEKALAAGKLEEMCNDKASHTLPLR